MFTWQSKYGDILINPDGLEIADNVVKEWEVEHKPPEPPLVKITPEQLSHADAYHAVQLAEQRGIPIHEAEEVICERIGLIPDPKDDTYLSQREQWELDRAIVFQNAMIDNCCYTEVRNESMSFRDVKVRGLIIEALKQDSAVPLVRVLTDRDESKNLYEAIVKHSALTWDNVLDAGRAIGVMRGGQPILEVSQSTTGGEAQSLTALLHIAASNFNTLDIQTKSISEQAYILALYLIKNWLAYYEYEDAKLRG